MKFTCTKEQIDRALRYSLKAVSKKSTLPITQNIAFIAQDSALMCVATNLDVGVRVSVSGKVEENGIAVIPPQLLMSFVSAMDDNAQITVSSDKNDNVSLYSDTSRASIKGFDGSDFPIIPENDNKNVTVTIDSDVFYKGMSRVVISVAKTEARPELTGVNLCFENSLLRAAATDGFRLSESIIPIEEGDNPEDVLSIIVPLSTVMEVLYVLSDSGVKKMTMHFGEGQVFFDIGDVAVVSRLITGTYPDYQQIIPSDHSTTLTLKRDLWERALRLSEVFANQTTSDMKLTIHASNNKAVIHAISQERGENTTDLDAECYGEDQEIFLNIRYVLDGIHRCGSDHVKIVFAGAAAPIVISPESDEQFLYLVMPIRK